MCVFYLVFFITVLVTWACASRNLCTLHVCRCPWGPENGGSEVPGGCKSSKQFNHQGYHPEYFLFVFVVFNPGLLWVALAALELALQTRLTLKSHSPASAFALWELQCAPSGMPVGTIFLGYFIGVLLPFQH